MVDYDVLIIGAGPAGLSAAMALARLSQSVLICDDNRPRNAASEHINNFAGNDGINPGAWRRQARADLEKYKTIHFVESSVTSAEKTDGGFTALLSSNRRVNIKKIVLAYGIRDRLPHLQGLNELWGKAVFHCPFCHGFEHRGSKLGLIANGEMASHVLPLVYELSKNLILFTNGKSELSSETLDILERRKIEVITGTIDRLIHDGETLKGVSVNGAVVERNAILCSPGLPFQLKSSIGESLGCEKTQWGLYKVSERNETSVKGVFAAGDNMTMQQSVVMACASGQLAGVGVVFDLLNDRFKRDHLDA